MDLNPYQNRNCVAHIPITKMVNKNMIELPQSYWYIMCFQHLDAYVKPQYTPTNKKQKQNAS